MRNILIKGSPGTGKTYFARALAYFLCKSDLPIKEVSQNTIDDKLEDIEEFVHSEYCEYVQVHPSMSYEDIVYGVEVRANSSLDIKYVEKRIKKLCDRANGKKGSYCIIFDDIFRVNAGLLLGNLIYAMEYRGQEVELVDGSKVCIPLNVFILFTDSNIIKNNKIDYALLRRMDYVQELIPSVDVIENYYLNKLGVRDTKLVKGIFLSIRDFVSQHADKGASASQDDYMLGHGMFIVSLTGNPINVLDRLKQKLIYQVFPYMTYLQSLSLLSGDLVALFSQVDNRINTGIESYDNVLNIDKLMYLSDKPALGYSVTNTKNYYLSSIIPSSKNFFRDVMECIVDLILFNEIFPKDIAVDALLTNTNIARIVSASDNAKYGSFIVKIEDADDFPYFSTKKGKKIPHYYYSKKIPKEGRWAKKEAIKYKISYKNNKPPEDYIVLNGFRSHGTNIDNPKVHPETNSANIYPAIYRLIDSYLDMYFGSIVSVMGDSESFYDLKNLILLEKKYLRLIHEGVKSENGDGPKFKYFREKIINLQTLWNSKGTHIKVDSYKYEKLIKLSKSFTLDSYEDIYSIDNTVKDIKIEGIPKMTALKEYQRVMENIGVRQMIFQGPPGTSKTFESKRFVLEQLAPKAEALSISSFVTQKDISEGLEQYRLTADDYNNPQKSTKIVTGGWDLVQFHPSYGYEDFIRGIEVSVNDGPPSYDTVNRILGKIAEFSQLAENNSESEPPKFYLIIDEINRANLATVFGELIYGLEYRNSNVSTAYEVENKATQTKTKDIKLGENLFIIGTMNTADKSIDSLDYAIRRRFIFIDSPPNRDVVIKSYQETSSNDDEHSIELLLFDAVQNLFDNESFFNSEYQKSDVRLGHSYFLRSKNSGYDKTIVERFIYQVIPILREYLKDGILDPLNDLIQLEHSTDSISANKDKNEQVKLLSHNLMLYVKEFGNENKESKIMDNEYISGFILEVCGKLGY